MVSSGQIYIFLFFIYILNDSVSVNSDKNVNSTFTPSHQWQKIENGQAIPPGLHVRIDLHTGEKEAKLPDIENGDRNKKALIPTNEKNAKPLYEDFLKPETLKEILKNIKPEDLPKSSVLGFKSYEELKKDISELDIELTTDIEFLTGLIDLFKTFNNAKGKNPVNEKANSELDDDILTVLVGLEFLVHQYDNAQEFARLNGFTDVVYLSLNSSNSEVRSEALRLLGSATQNNPKVQIAAVDSGSIHLLLKILTFDEDIDVRSRSLFALSCLVRKFPAAQEKLIADGGLTTFANIFDENKQDLLKLQVKIITLIHDLLFERKDAKMNLSEEENGNHTESKIETLKEKLRQYEKINLEKKLVEQEWCKRIPRWFINQNNIKELIKSVKSGIKLESINIGFHDIIEKVVDTLYALSDICRSQFQRDPDFVNLLMNLKSVYAKLAAVESKMKDDETNQYYNSLSNVLVILTDKFKKTVEKHEL